MSIKYEVVGCLRAGTVSAGLALALQEWQRYTLTTPTLTDRSDSSKRLPTLRDNDSLVGQVFQQCEALPSELGNAQVPHI